MINSRRQRRPTSGVVAVPRRLPPAKTRTSRGPGSSPVQRVGATPNAHDAASRKQEPALAASGLIGRKLPGTREFRASQELSTDSVAYQRQNAQDHKGRSAQQRGFPSAPRPAAASTNQNGTPSKGGDGQQTGFVSVDKVLAVESTAKALNFAAEAHAAHQVASDRSAMPSGTTPQSNHRRKNTHGKIVCSPVRAGYDEAEAKGSARVTGGSGTSLQGMSLSDRVPADHDAALMAASRHLQDIQHRIERYANRRFGDVHAFKRQLPSDEGGNINLGAFLQGAKQLGLPVTQDEAALLFSALDRNADGLLGAEHIARVVKPSEHTGLPMGSVQAGAMSSSKGRRHQAPQHTHLLQAAAHVYQDVHAGDEAGDEATRDFLAFTAAQVPHVKAVSQAMYSARGSRREGTAVAALVGGGTTDSMPPPGSSPTGDASLEQSRRAARLKQACDSTLQRLGAVPLPDGRVRFSAPLRDVHAPDAVETPRMGAPPPDPSADGVVRLAHPVTRQRAPDLAAEAAIVQQELRERVSTKRPKKFLDMLKRFDPYSRGYFTQDQFLALVADHSGLNMRLDARRARVLLHTMAAPNTGMVPQHAVMAFLRNDKSQYAPSVAEHMAHMEQNARSALETQVRNKQEHIQQQLAELQKEQHAKDSAAAGIEGLQSAAHRSGGRFKPGTRSGEAWDEEAWSAAPSAIGALSRSENPVQASKFAAGGFGASGQPLLHAHLQAAARGFTDAVTAGRSFPDGDDAGDLLPAHGTHTLADTFEGGDWPAASAAGEAGDGGVVVVLPSRGSHRKGAAAASDMPRCTGNIGQSGNPVDGPIAGAHLLGMRGGAGVGDLQRQMAQSLSASHMLGGSNRTKAWGSGTLGASASSAQLHSTMGSTASWGGRGAAGGGLGASASTPMLPTLPHQLSTVHARARRQGSSVAHSRPQTSPTSAGSRGGGSWGGSRPATAASPSIVLHGGGNAVQAARELMFHPNVDAATPARVHAWRKAASEGGAPDVGGGRLSDPATPLHAAVVDLRSLTPQQGVMTGTLSGTDAVSSASAEGALRRETLRASGTAKAAQGQGGGENVRFNTPARTRAQAWRGGSVGGSAVAADVGVGGGRQPSREMRQRMHRGHAGVFTPSATAPAAPRSGSDAYWVKATGGATTGQAGAVLPGRSARAGSPAAARRRAIFGEGHRPPAHTVASERKFDAVGAVRQEAALLAHQLRALHGPRR